MNDIDIASELFCEARHTKIMLTEEEQNDLLMIERTLVKLSIKIDELSKHQLQALSLAETELIAVGTIIE